jgi:uncharacterized membrane protein
MFLAQRRLNRSIDHERIKTAIGEAERHTSGEIRVSIAPFFWGSVEAAARMAFERLGMRATRDRNAILFFVVPSRRRFTVLGDEGIHAKVGPDFWKTVVAAMEGPFRKGDFTGGLVQGIAAVGHELGAHFPFEKADVNELPNDVDLGPDR